MMIIDENILNIKELILVVVNIWKLVLIALYIYCLVEFEIPKDITWIKFNVGQRGLYRVNYDGAGWEMLTNLLLTDHERISAADRASIIDDAFTLAR